MLLPGRNEFRPSGREPIAGLLRLRLEPRTTADPSTIPNFCTTDLMPNSRCLLFVPQVEYRLRVEMIFLLGHLQDGDGWDGCSGRQAKRTPTRTPRATPVPQAAPDFPVCRFAAWTSHIGAAVVVRRSAAPGRGVPLAGGWCGAPLVRAGIRLGGGARCGALPASVSCSCWARLLVFRRVLRLLCCASCRAGGCVRLAVRAVALAARSCRVPRSLAPWVLRVCCGTGARRSRRRPPRQTPKAKSVRLCSRVGVLRVLRVDVRVVLHNVAHICEQKTTAIARTLPCVAMAEVRPPQTRFSEGNSG